MGGVVRLCALLERPGVGFGQLDGGPRGLADRDRVETLKQQLAAFASLLARFGQADGMQRPQPVVAFAAGTVAKHPIALVLEFDVQIETAAVVVPAFAEPSYLHLRQPSKPARHGVSRPHFRPHSRASIGETQ